MSQKLKERAKLTNLASSSSWERLTNSFSLRQSTKAEKPDTMSTAR